MMKSIFRWMLSLTLHLQGSISPLHCMLHKVARYSKRFSRLRLMGLTPSMGGSLQQGTSYRGQRLVSPPHGLCLVEVQTTGHLGLAFKSFQRRTCGLPRARSYRWAFLGIR